MPTDFRDWTIEQQRLFFRVYRHMRLNQAQYLPKGSTKIPTPTWNVISGAAARMAAEMLEAEPTGNTFSATLQEE